MTESTGEPANQERQDFSSLRQLGPDARQAKLTELLNEIAVQGEEGAQELASKLIDVEYSLPDDEFRSFTESRLKALLALDGETAMRAVNAYEAVMAGAPGDIAFKHIAAVQGASREMSQEDLDRLKGLMPNAFGDKPREVSVATPGPAEPEQGYPHERWSTFWARKKNA